ncbi:MAG: hypothetical protein EVB09_08055 [Verrucomicrobiaceae bacterium]|nr:MAG: hypothetical protein EVB09_08055 [Verrucomicrobiaceae bacterium]
MKPFLALILFVLPSCVGISGSVHEPLSLAESGRGMLVLDGHERAAVRQEKSVPKSLPATSIPWSWFN